MRDLNRKEEKTLNDIYLSDVSIENNFDSSD